MERRLAILQKKSKHDVPEYDSPNQLENHSPFYDGMAPSASSLTTPRMRRTHRDSVLSSDRHPPRSRSNSNDRVVGRPGHSSRLSSHSGTPVPQDVPQELGVAVGGIGGSSSVLGKRAAAKRKLSDNLSVATETTSKRRRLKQAEVRTRVEYGGLNLSLRLLPPPPRGAGGAECWGPPSGGGDGYPLQTFCDVRTNAATTNHHHPHHHHHHQHHLLASSGSSSSRRSSPGPDLANSMTPTSSLFGEGVAGGGGGGGGGKGVVNGNDTTSAIVVPSWRTCPVRASSDPDDLDDDPVIMEVRSLG